MANERTPRLHRWRALLSLLWRAHPRAMALFGVLVAALGVLPTAVILLTGALVEALPAAAGEGMGGPAARPALWALAGLVAALATLSVGGNYLWRVCRVLNAAYELHLHEIVARVTLGTPDVAPLEDPALADRLQGVLEAERRGGLARTASELSAVVTTRLRGAGAFVVLLGFAWWAPLALAAAWYLTNRVYLRASAEGAGLDVEDAPGVRRAGYLRGLALEAPAAKEVRVFGLGEWVVGRYTDTWTRALGEMWRMRRAHLGLTAAAMLALAAAHGAALGALGLAASRGQVEVAALLVFAQAIIATSDLGMIGDSQWWLDQSLTIAARVDGLRADAGARLLDVPAAVLPPPAPADRVAVRLDGLRGVRAAGEARRGVAVRFQDVRFTYRGRARPTLDGLDLDVPAGQSLAVVGENGAGKSTLIKLLCGLYVPDAGRVLLDGVAPLQARGRVAVIFQDFVRYRLPLRENVGFGRLPLLHDTHALEGALRDAGAGALLDTLPDGWDTVLSREFEGGADLSGGQWQRVALARALAAVRGGAGLLILDEPTASLDVRAEAELFDRFLELTRGITTVLVSHRLSSVRRADRIVVVHGGRVAEDGTHDALMAAGGRYAAMFTLQAERFAAGEAADPAREEVGNA